MEETTKTIKPLPKEESVEPRFTFISFRLGNEEYGIPIEQVKEVTLTPGITKVPQSPPYILGISNIRGDIIAVLDLEKKLNLRNQQGDEGNIFSEKSYTIVLDRKGLVLGVQVAEVPETVSVMASQIDKTPEIIKNSANNEKYVEGIAKINNRLIIILETEKIINIEEERQLTNG